MHGWVHGLVHGCMGGGDVGDVFFFFFNCVLWIKHLNYHEKSTFKFIGDLVQVICYLRSQIQIFML